MASIPPDSTPAVPSQPAPVAATPYPVSFDVEYPTDKRNRVTVFFRSILAIPVIVLLEMFINSSSTYSGDTGTQAAVTVGGFLFLPTLLLLLFRHRYPRWWFDGDARRRHLSAVGHVACAHRGRDRWKPPHGRQG